MANSKIRLKVGQIEIDYEGDHDFLKADLLSLLKETVAIAGSSPVPLEPQTAPATAGAGQPSRPTVGTVNAISAKLQVTSGVEMIIAAAAKMHFVDSKATFSRQDILDAMRSAPNYYKASYRNNLSRSLKQLQDDQKITEVAADKFALTASTVTSLEASLAK